MIRIYQYIKEIKTMNQDEFKKIISNAITQEVEAFTFYSSVSEKAKDENLKKIFPLRFANFTT